MNIDGGRFRHGEHAFEPTHSDSKRKNYNLLLYKALRFIKRAKCSDSRCSSKKLQCFAVGSRNLRWDRRNLRSDRSNLNTGTQCKLGPICHQHGPSKTQIKPMQYDIFRSMGLKTSSDSDYHVFIA